MSDAPVYYHHPDDEQFSLDYVADSQDTLDERLASYDDSVETAVETYDLDETVFAVYVRSGPIGTVDGLDYDFTDSFQAMDSTNRAIARQYFQVFKGVNNEKKDQEGRPLDAYKPLEIASVPDALDRVRWDETVPIAGGTLISNLILRHALPNANHRTAFGLLELYLESVDSKFSMPSMATDDYDWQDWVDPFIVDSKRLTTVRRNVACLRILSQFGCDTLLRKGDVAIELSEYELDMRYYEALEEYAQRHEQRSIEFTETIIRQAGESMLLDKEGMSKAEFAEQLSALND